MNEAVHLAETVRTLRERHQSADQPEIIVCDCGSSDGTEEVARNLRLVVARAPERTRRCALNTGAAVAGGDVFLFLHADTIVPWNYCTIIAGILSRPRAAAGAFTFAFTESSPVLQIVTVVNRMRYRVSKECYGDQGLFCTREAFETVGGYPDMPILEDAGICRRFKQLGRFRIAREASHTSARRFIEGGPLRVFAHDLWIWLHHLLGLSTNRFAVSYQKNNVYRGASSEESKGS